jgi:hypothetical protein
MLLLKKLSIATAGASAILSVLSVPVSAFTINLPANANWDILDPLGNLPAGATGTVGLNPVVPKYLAPPAAGSTFFTRFAADAVTQFPGWTAVSGTPLGGILTINEYDARDYAAEPDPKVSTPAGGVDMDATYTRTATDPAIADLRFIQMFTYNTGKSHIDPFPNTDTLPWYWTEGEHAYYSTPTTMSFGDFPVVSGLTQVPFNSSVLFETYLATFNNTTKVATIHDGWSWGYDINVQTEAVPEPLTILASATALGFGAFFKRQVSRKPKKN